MKNNKIELINKLAELIEPNPPSGERQIDITVISGY
jgi:hypothetical protein